MSSARSEKLTGRSVKLKNILDDMFFMQFCQNLVRLILVFKHCETGRILTPPGYVLLTPPTFKMKVHPKLRT